MVGVVVGGAAGVLFVLFVLPKIRIWQAIKKNKLAEMVRIYYVSSFFPFC